MLPRKPSAFVNFIDVDLGRFRKDFVGRWKNQRHQSVSWEHVLLFEDSKLSLFRDRCDRIGFVRGEFFLQAKTAEAREQSPGVGGIAFAFLSGLGVFGAMQIYAKGAGGLSARFGFIPIIYLSHFMAAFPWPL